jgi:hypothetical protein
MRDWGALLATEGHRVASRCSRVDRHGGEVRFGNGLGRRPVPLAWASGGPCDRATQSGGYGTESGESRALRSLTLYGDHVARHTRQRGRWEGERGRAEPTAVRSFYRQGWSCRRCGNLGRSPAVERRSRSRRGGQSSSKSPSVGLPRHGDPPRRDTSRRGPSRRCQPRCRHAGPRTGGSGDRRDGDAGVRGARGLGGVGIDRRGHQEAGGGRWRGSGGGFGDRRRGTSQPTPASAGGCWRRLKRRNRSIMEGTSRAIAPRGPE